MRTPKERALRIGTIDLIFKCDDHHYVPIMNGTLMWCPSCKHAYEIDVEDYE